MQKWREYVFSLDRNLAELEKEIIVYPGVLPYARVVPALFLNNFIIYCARDCQDITLLREVARVACLEQRHPDVAKKVQGTGYLLHNYYFQGYLAKLKKPYRLFLYNISEFIQKGLTDRKHPYIGNLPKTHESVRLKSNFRALLQRLDLPHLPHKSIPRQDFLEATFIDIEKIFKGPAVLQRGDYEAGGERATFFIKAPEDLDEAKKQLAKDTRFTKLNVSPFVHGDSLSMVGCATRHGTLTGSLQLQLIDVPESLRLERPSGVFLGHDWLFKNWGDKTEQLARKVVQEIGRHLYQQGYKGIFGIDFILDERTKNLYALECNPRFTGSQPWFPLLAIMQGLPPFEFFHLAEHLNLDVELDFEALNKDYLFQSNFSDISITATKLRHMPVELPIGIYRADGDEITHLRREIFPWNIQDDNEFLITSPVYKKGAALGNRNISAFKIVFPDSIAESSYQLKPKYKTIVQTFSDLLYDAEV